MAFIVVGTNYKHSPVTFREKISFSKKKIEDALLLLKERAFLKGAVILSTCNRAEIYASCENIERGVEKIEDFISFYCGLERNEVTSYLYIYENETAIRHLFHVASGLDSLILGETQILGQVREAFYGACDLDFVDDTLNKIFISAMSFAGRVHKETKLSEGRVSVGSMALDFVKRKFGDISGKNILLIGVGKVTELVLKYLKKENPNVIFVSNRTYDKAKEFAAQIRAKAVRFDNLKEFLKKADIVITATASPRFIISEETFDKDIKRRLLIIDLAMPRDVDPDIKKLDNVELYSLEDLDLEIRRNRERKIKEAEKIKEIIEVEANSLWSQISALEPEPALLP